MKSKMILFCCALVLVLSPKGWALGTGEEKEPLSILEDAFAGIAERVRPSVVNITSEKSAMMEEKSMEQFKELFKEFFGVPGVPPQLHPKFFKEKAGGSGVMVDKEGYILTNYHLVQEAENIKVRLTDEKKEYEAKVVGVDPRTDLAVIKIEKADEEFMPAQLGDSDNLRVGQWAIAIGNPFALDKTLTVGVISATGRHGFGGLLSEVTYQDFIQTDASINPGNSGGPLVNIRGEVIGVNTFIIGLGTGIGFAIPINLAKSVYSDILKHGRVVRGWLGVAIRDLTEGLAQSLGLPDLKGALIDQVIEDTPAEKAGLKPGDVIRKVNDQEIENAKQLQELITRQAPGSKVVLTLLREGAEKKLSVPLGEVPAPEGAVTYGPPGEAEGKLGLRVQNLTPEIAEAQGLKTTDGVLVSEIDPEGPASEEGIVPGDIILEVNRKKVSNTEEFYEIMKGVKPDQYVSLFIQREGHTLFFAVKAGGAQ